MILRGWCLQGYGRVDGVCICVCYCCILAMPNELWCYGTWIMGYEEWAMVYALRFYGALR